MLLRLLTGSQGDELLLQHSIAILYELIVTQINKVPQDTYTNIFYYFNVFKFFADTATEKKKPLICMRTLG